MSRTQASERNDADSGRALVGRGASSWPGVRLDAIREIVTMGALCLEGRGTMSGASQVLPAARTWWRALGRFVSLLGLLSESKVGVPQGAAASATARIEVASCSASTRAMGRSIADWYGASPWSTAGRADAATPTLPSGTSMASKC
jgi:hypothetical protein